MCRVLGVRSTGTVEQDAGEVGSVGGLLVSALGNPLGDVAEGSFGALPKIDFGAERVGRAVAAVELDREPVARRGDDGSAVVKDNAATVGEDAADAGSGLGGALANGAFLPAQA